MVGAAFVLDLLTVFLVFAWGNSYLIDVLRAPAAAPGYALAIYGFVKLVSAPAGGWLLGRAGTRAMLASAIALEAAGLAVALLLETTAGFLGCIALLGAGVALSWIVIFFEAGRAGTFEERGSAGTFLSISSGMASAGALAVAPLFSIFLADRAAFAFAGLLVAAQAGLLALSPNVRAGADSSPTSALPPPGRTALALVLFGHFALVSGAVAALIPFVLKTLDLSLARAVITMGPAVAVAAGLTLWSGRRGASEGRFQSAPLFYGAAAAALVALSFATSPLLAALVTIPVAGGLAAAAPLINSSVLDATDHRHAVGPTLGWFFFAEGAGAVAGPAVVAAVIALTSVRPGLATAGMGLAVLALGVLYAHRRHLV